MFRFNPIRLIGRYIPTKFLRSPFKNTNKLPYSTISNVEHLGSTKNGFPMIASNLVSTIKEPPTSCGSAIINKNLITNNIINLQVYTTIIGSLIGLALNNGFILVSSLFIPHIIICIVKSYS